VGTLCHWVLPFVGKGWDQGPGRCWRTAQGRLVVVLPVWEIRVGASSFDVVSNVCSIILVGGDSSGGLRGWSARRVQRGVRLDGTEPEDARIRFGTRDSADTQMTPPVHPRDRWILHFTHVDNLPSILAAGGIVCDGNARGGLTQVEVGDVGIKEMRRSRMVPVAPGGCVGDYVPFYFAPRSPMMFRIACDHRDAIPGRYPDGDRPLAYLVTTVGAVVDAGLTWVAADGNAATATTHFTGDLDDLDSLVDWPLMLAGMWKDTFEDPDRQRRRMAELLVHREVPLAVIRLVAAYSEEHARRARAGLTGHELANQVVVRPRWYYGYRRRG
jgi:hypothetical protein